MKTIQVEISDQAVEHIKRLHASGLYGVTMQQTIDQLICEGLEKRLHSGTLSRQ